MPKAKKVRIWRGGAEIISCKGYFLGGARFYILHDSDSDTRVERFHSRSLVQSNTAYRSSLECL